MRNDLKHKLIIEGADTVMIQQDQIPILEVEGHYVFDPSMPSTYGWSTVLIRAINFLRAGVPEVHIWWGRFTDEAEREILESDLRGFVYPIAENIGLSVDNVTSLVKLKKGRE